MKRKDNTVKQLQAECKKRNIGFMTNWTKTALIKRLEDEDNREKVLVKVQKELEKTKKQGEDDILKAQKEKAKVEKELISFEGAKKPADIISMLEGERDNAQTDYDELHKEIEKLSTKKLEVGTKVQEARLRLKHIDEAISTIKQVL